MINISIRHNFPQVIQALKELPEKAGGKAMVRAMNTTITQAKPAMAQQISKEFNVTSAQVKERLTVRRAIAKPGEYRFEAELKAANKAKGRGANLIAFQDGVLTKRTAKRAGRAQSIGQLGFQIKRAGGRKVVTGAFIGNDGRTVFIRVGKKRMPIKAVSTIDITQMFNTRRINEVVVATILKRFEANFNRELRSVLKGYIK